jgi:hypothetical protein
MELQVAWIQVLVIMIQALRVMITHCATILVSAARIQKHLTTIRMQLQITGHVAQTIGPRFKLKMVKRVFGYTVSNIS